MFIRITPKASIPKKRNKSKFDHWLTKFRLILAEKPFHDASTIAILNIENLMKKDYETLLQKSKEALIRNPNNQEARIENFVARYRLNKNFDAHAAELFNLRLELMKINVTKPAFSIALELLYSYFHNFDKAVIHQHVVSNSFNSVLEEFIMKLIDYYSEKEDFVNFHTDLLASQDHLYLFWLCHV